MDAARQHKPYEVAVAGHGLAAVIGAASLIAGIVATTKSLPAVMSITLIVIGGLLPALAHYSWRFSRAAWSLMISTLAVFAAVTFFGAPKIAAVMHVSLGVAFIIPVVQVLAVIALADLRAEFREQG